MCSLSAAVTFLTSKASYSNTGFLSKVLSTVSYVHLVQTHLSVCLNLEARSMDIALF